MNTDAALPHSMQHLIAEVSRALAHRPKLARMFARCFPNTLQTTINKLPDATTFVITGDIPAMWLRDSAAQVRPYLVLAAADAAVADLLEGVVRRQMRYILHDPYANAFNAAPNGRGHQSDLTEMSALVWERKYEIDSLCYPIQLAYLLWKATGRTRHFDQTFRDAARAIVEVWRREQRHPADSFYRFERLDTIPIDTLSHGGRGSPVAETGMTWSGFRPSDDACAYGYLVPSNLFAVVALGYLVEIATQVLSDAELAAEAQRLRAAIDVGIQAYGKVEHPRYGTIYAYETDGLGNYNLMDDANVPSLLSLPYLGYCAKDDPVYLNTRAFVLSSDNPYFYRGAVAEGIGSPHTPAGYIWHIALTMQGLTAADPAERERILDLLERTDAGTNLMHEGFAADDPSQFTRPWFAWANSLLSELVLEYCGFNLPH
jgi:uncharacterized protein